MLRQKRDVLRRAYRARAWVRRAESSRHRLWRAGGKPLRKREEFVREATKDRSRPPWPCQAIKKIRDQARRDAYECQRPWLRGILRRVYATLMKRFALP